MKIAFLLLFIPAVSCFTGKESIYVGSTPADAIIRSFLGIPNSDSVDFIRWRIAIAGEEYSLQCNYGISKPGTPGFWNGGKWIEIKGKVTKRQHYFSFENGNKVLSAIEINGGLLHLVDEERNLLVGNGGFSYSLNNRTMPVNEGVTVISTKTSLKDSMVYQGRTLCHDFSINRPSAACAKMKWSIVFYADARTNTPSGYILNRNRFSAGKKGSWKILTGKDGRIIYELKPENSSIPTYLLKVDDNILWFTDAEGNLLVGNEDFSFSLNRKI